MKKTKYIYTNADNLKCGEMICQKCNQKITSGEYRYKEMNHKFDFVGYVSHEHKFCSESGDTGWAIREMELAQRLNQMKEKLVAFESFANQWNTDALDEEIEYMKGILQ